MIEYGHDSQGGFYAIDEAERIAYYAYPSSPNADTAKSGAVLIVRCRFPQATGIRE